MAKLWPCSKNRAKKAFFCFFKAASPSLFWLAAQPQRLIGVELPHTKEEGRRKAKQAIKERMREKRGVFFSFQLADALAVRMR